MTKIEEIEARIREENQDNCDMTETEIITEIAQEYAKICIAATISVIAKDHSYHINPEEGEAVNVVEVSDLFNPENVVLL